MTKEEWREIVRKRKESMGEKYEPLISPDDDEFSKKFNALITTWEKIIKEIRGHRLKD